MNQDIELMRGLLLWVADAESWEVSYRQQQVSLKPDGSVDDRTNQSGTEVPDDYHL